MSKYQEKFDFSIYNPFNIITIVVIQLLYIAFKITFFSSLFQGPITGQHKYCCYWSSLVIWSSCTPLIWWKGVTPHWRPSSWSCIWLLLFSRWAWQKLGLLTEHQGTDIFTWKFTGCAVQLFPCCLENLSSLYLFIKSDTYLRLSCKHYFL